MDWFKGKFPGKHHIWWENPWFPVDFPLNQSIFPVKSPAPRWILPHLLPLPRHARWCQRRLPRRTMRGALQQRRRAAQRGGVLEVLWSFAVSGLDINDLTIINHYYQRVSYTLPLLGGWPMSLHSNVGMSENGVYPQWNSHLVGIMISKTIGFRGLAYFQTNPYSWDINGTIIWVNYNELTTSEPWKS